MELFKQGIFKVANEELIRWGLIGTIVALGLHFLGSIFQGIYSFFPSWLE